MIFIKKIGKMVKSSYCFGSRGASSKKQGAEPPLDCLGCYLLLIGFLVFFAFVIFMVDTFLDVVIFVITTLYNYFTK